MSATVDLVREVRKEMARRSLPFFMTYYLRTDEGEPFTFEDCHVEMADLCTSEAPEDDALLFLEPAGIGKTTIMFKGYPLHLCYFSPNSRVAAGGKTFDDAKARLRAIKAEIENNPRLLEDFGNIAGEVWTDSEITVRGRTIVAKEPTIKVFGSENSVFGWRATHAILDDIVTLKNSGPTVRPDTRARLRANFNDGVRKMKIPGQRFRIRWANTVVDLRDLTHEIGDLGHHPNEKDVTWRAPSGFKVLRRQAIDEVSGELLSPRMLPAEELLLEKQQDPVSFLRRRQNRVIEPELMTFQKEWITGDQALGLPGCLDWDRSMGRLPVWDGVSWTRTAGYDPTAGLSENAKWCAWVEVAFDRHRDDPRLYLIDNMARFRKTLPEQVAFIVANHRAHGVAKTKIEENAAQMWIRQLKEVQDAIASGARIGPHWTTQSGKYDPDTGIPDLAGMVRAGLIRFPYGDALSRSMSDVLIGEMLDHPMGATSDVLMALWFAVLAAREVAKEAGVRIVAQLLPAWARSRGIAVERALLSRWGARAPRPPSQTPSALEVATAARPGAVMLGRVGPTNIEPR